MAIVSLLFQWIGVAFLVGSIILIIRENKKSLPTLEEKEFLIQTGVIPADCKNKKILRQATRDYRTTQYVLKSLRLTKEEILQLSLQAKERKEKEFSVQVPADNKK